MIKMVYLVDCNGADKFGTCMGCGRSNKEDPWMIRITLSFTNHGTSFCLCDECRTEMKRMME